ncbi:TIGR02391 family protein [Pseudomonas sp. S12(2018)]|uniref:TIGR02391 family protein n=1 Tax=Pseudomonas sp. S12(2018) TaxID=2219664 RepID=UPI0020CF52A0|nr:TIGR02391 family protein [Pseudomonas sp. S12(2018)]
MSVMAAAVRQYQVAYEVVLDMHRIWEHSEPQELYEKYQALDAEVERLLSFDGVEAGAFGNLKRHLWFIELRLRQGFKSACFDDIKDIIYNDLPSGFTSLLALEEQTSHLHGRFRESVLPLLDGGHLGAAIREVFPILSTYLRQRFLVSQNIDGDELVNYIFGGGSAVTNLEGAKKTAYRNMLSGFYGVYRNKYAHHDVAPSLAEVHAVIELANSLIFEMEIVAVAAAEAEEAG